MNFITEKQFYVAIKSRNKNNDDFIINGNSPNQ